MDLLWHPFILVVHAEGGGALFFKGIRMHRLESAPSPRTSVLWDRAKTGDDCITDSTSDFALDKPVFYEQQGAEKGRPIQPR